MGIAAGCSTARVGREERRDKTEMKTVEDNVKTTFTALAIASIAFLGGCRSTPDVAYGDATGVDPMTTDFEASDLQQIAVAMVDSLLEFPAVVALTRTDRPVVLVGRVKNKTMQHIDTEALTDTIRTRLIRSGTFRFIDRTTDDEVIEEIKIQLESGLVDPKTARQFGRQIGAKFLLTSNLAEIVRTKGRVKDVYYKFTMNLKNLDTGILEWADEKEIRKVRTRRRLGL